MMSKKAKKSLELLRELGIERGVKLSESQLKAVDDVIIRKADEIAGQTHKAARNAITLELSDLINNICGEIMDMGIPLLYSAQRDPDTDKLSVTRKPDGAVIYIEQ